MPGRFYIAPNSTIVLLRDVPIDQAQEHTLWFPDANTQTNYFLGKNGVTLSQQYYVRQGRGVIKVEATPDLIYNCNYLMYKNTSFGNKWFYAFITSIEYANNNTATVTFVIDQMQTWFFEMELGQSFVEREHALYDGYGENLVYENLETGEFLYTRPMRDTSFDTMAIVIASTIKLNQAGTDFEDAEGFALDGLYSGVAYYFREFNPAGIADINNFLALATEKGKADSIVSVFMAPLIVMQSSQYPAPFVSPFEYYFRPSTFEGYTPHNNKLLTAPYVSIAVKTPTNMAEYAWEYFKYPLQPQFEITCQVSTSPSLMLTPKVYKTSSDTTVEVDKNYVESMVLDRFPQCAYTIDTYKAWLAQNGASLAVNGALALGGLALSLGLAAATGGASMVFTEGLTSQWTPPWENSTESKKSTAGIVGSVGTIGNILAQIYQHSILPPHAMGNADGSIYLANRLMNFQFFTKTIRREYAEIIDQYFDKYGYATHKVKIPNIHARAIWTYTKTVDCIIHGNLPTEAITEIQNIFNRGVTFWADPTKVGHYELGDQNTPLGA